MHHFNSIVPVKDYEGTYMVSSLGSVYRVNPKGLTLLTPGTFPNGYNYVRLTKTGKRKNALLHRIIATAFIPNPQNLPEVNHKDLIRSNNSINNLEWCTKSENAIHSVLNNKNKKPRKDYKPILDLKTGVFYYGTKELSHLYGIKRRTLIGVLNGNSINKTSFVYA